MEELENLIDNIQRQKKESMSKISYEMSVLFVALKANHFQFEFQKFFRNLSEKPNN